MMAGIRGKNTATELMLRSGLHLRGFRFRIHRPDLPGKPDIVFPKYGAVVFAHGCFWHGHNCHLFKWPQTRADFWESKIEANKCRDVNSMRLLKDGGWRIGIVWECALKGRKRLKMDELLDRCEAWLLSGTEYLEFVGNESRLPV